MNIDMDSLYHTWQSQERLFGVIAMSLGIISKEQLEECLKLQKKHSDDWHMLGTIMLEKGYMTESQIQQVIDAQTEMDSPP
jgi:hypothetical protein